MIRLLSPYYVTTPWVSTNSGLTSTDYTLHIYVWTGAKASVPGTANYTITKDNYGASTGSDTIDISDIIGEELEFVAQMNATTAVVNGVNQVWVKTEVTYTTSDPTDASTPQEASTNLASLGYTYGDEGANQTTAPGAFMSNGDNFRASKTGYFILPIRLSESLSYDLTAISYPANNLNFSTTLSATTQSSELVKYLVIKMSDAGNDKYIEVIYNTKSKIIWPQEEPKYSPVTFLFSNQYGGQETCVLFKEQRDTITFESQIFERDNGQPSAGFHQYKKFNSQGKKKGKVKSGWMYEDANSQIQELLLSDNVWILQGVNPLPVKIESSQLEVKTKVLDKMIQYEVEYLYAYNLINSI